MLTDEERVSLLIGVVGDTPIPRKKLKEKHMLRIITATCNAHGQIKKTQKNYNAFSEIEMTIFMQEKLTRMINSDHNFSKIVYSVDRGGEYFDYNAKKLENRPDLTFKIRNHIRPGLIIFVEAKIIFQKGNSWKKIELYCQEGIMRFVSGQYAWQESEAIMFGYVKDGSSINPTLTAYLNKGQNPSISKRFAVHDNPIAVPKIKGDVAYSVHYRNFPYHPKFKSKPGKIKIWHVWLK